MVQNEQETKSSRGRRPVSADEIRQCAEEAPRYAHRFKAEKEKQALTDLAHYGDKLAFTGSLAAPKHEFEKADCVDIRVMFSPTEPV